MWRDEKLMYQIWDIWDGLCCKGNAKTFFCCFFNAKCIIPKSFEHFRFIVSEILVLVLDTKVKWQNVFL